MSMRWNAVFPHLRLQGCSQIIITNALVKFKNVEKTLYLKKEDIGNDVNNFKKVSFVRRFRFCNADIHVNAADDAESAPWRVVI